VVGVWGEEEKRGRDQTGEKGVGKDGEGEKEERRGEGKSQRESEGRMECIQC